VPSPQDLRSKLTHPVSGLVLSLINYESVHCCWAGLASLLLARTLQTYSTLGTEVSAIYEIAQKEEYSCQLWPTQFYSFSSCIFKLEYRVMYIRYRYVVLNQANVRRSRTVLHYIYKINPWTFPVWPVRRISNAACGRLPATIEDYYSKKAKWCRLWARCSAYSSLEPEILTQSVLP
jgi:hypothetical protein